MLAPPDPRSEKRRLRQAYREARRAITPENAVRAAASLAALAADCPEICRARTVLGYVAGDGEIGVAAVLAAASSSGATILLPRLAPPDSSGSRLELVDWAPGTAVNQVGPGGTVAPSGPAVDLGLCLAQPAPACVLVPAVALAPSGARLGRGGGHYDRLLPRLREAGWALIGVCHNAQLVAALPTETHDVHVDAVLTDLRFLRVAPGPAGR